MAGNVYYLRIFADGQFGGNPLPLVVDAAGMADAEMQFVAASAGHESGFVFLAPEHSNYDYEFRFWVPSMRWRCAVMLRLALCGCLKGLEGYRGTTDCDEEEGGNVGEISQGKGVVEAVPNDAGIYEDFLSTLGIEASGLSQRYPIQNSKTSRVKTVIPVQSVNSLDGLRPKPQAVRSLCERIGSTGLYPFAVIVGEGKQVFSARQFPKNSGYIEDAATGIAASALAFALLENGLVDMESEITVKQGRAMGAPSSIAVRFRKGASGEIEGC